MRSGSLLVVALSLGSFSRCALATEWNLANDFSAASNPAGAWSYGSSSGLGGVFSLNLGPYTPCPLTEGWTNGYYSDLTVMHNAHAFQVLCIGGVPLLANQVAVHPGPDIAYCVLRWTAPFTDVYRIEVTFEGRDYDGASTDVHVSHNASVLFNGSVSGIGVPVSFQCDGLQLAAGDVIDFTVGAGAGCNDANDATAIDARIVSGATGVGCATVPPQPGCLGPECSDGIDNDGDGCADYPLDLGCTSPSDNSEAGGGCGPACSDGFDNDGDGCADYPRDLGCTSPTDNSEDGGGCPGTTACDDGIDNDGDGCADYPRDLGCESRADNSEAEAGCPVCWDGIDNDGDGCVDYPADPGCTDYRDSSEADAACVTSLVPSLSRRALAVLSLVLAAAGAGALRHRGGAGAAPI